MCRYSLSVCGSVSDWSKGSRICSTSRWLLVQKPPRVILRRRAVELRTLLTSQIIYLNSWLEERVTACHTLALAYCTLIIKLRGTEVSSKRTSTSSPLPPSSLPQNSLPSMSNPLSCSKFSTVWDLKWRLKTRKLSLTSLRKPCQRPSAKAAVPWKTTIDPDRRAIQFL